ncbi:MAG: hypothetical protein WD875_10505 [Pirellulales bacterium]
MPNMLPILAAPNFGDLLSALVPVVIFVIWVVGQIANRAKPPAAKPIRRPQRRADADADWANNADDDVVVAQAAGDGEKKTVFDEIEQFLARARQQTQQGKTPQRPVAAKPIVAEPVVAQLATPRRGLSGEMSSTSGNLSARTQVATQVKEYLDTSDIDAHVELLGDAVEIADDVMEAHLKEVFDHRIGTLQQMAAETPATRRAASNAQKRAAGQRVTVPPVDFAAMLANAGSLRKAIVLTEILQRPSERW